MDTLSRLADALRCLPGIGPKSARRMTWHLLQHQRENGIHLANCLMDAMQHVRHCTRCQNYTEHTLCTLCTQPGRDATLLCVVETPADILAIEQSNRYKGSYFVLMGKISPLDGIGPEELKLPLLHARVKQESVREVILALSPTVEGHTTTHFIQELLKNTGARISELARGIPTGGELEFLDSTTIGNALQNRATLATRDLPAESGSAS